MDVIDTKAPEAIPNEIEVTLAMIEAGIKTFRANATCDPNEREIRQTVLEIFAAMSQAAYRLPTENATRHP